MANPLEKLKGLNFKELLLEHGEKFGLGLVALLGVGVLLGAQYKGTEITPKQIEDKVELAERNLQTSVLTDEMKTELKLTKPLGMEDQVRLLEGGQLAGTRLATTGTLITTPYSPPKPIDEPTWLPIRNLQASFGRVSLLVDAAPEDPLNLDGSDPEDPLNPVLPDGPDVDLDLTRKVGAPDPRVGPNGLDDENDDFDLGGPEAGNVFEGDEEGMFDPEGYGPVSTVNGEGHRYVALTGVYNLRDQLEAIEKALQLKAYSLRNIDLSGPRALEDYLFIVDFELVRQKAVPGDDPWSGPWKWVDLRKASEILSKSTDQDFDPLNPAVSDPAITMPLPARVFGNWDPRQVSHRDVEQFRLSEEDAKRYEVYIQQLLELKRAQEEEAGPEVQKGGFAGYTGDFNAMSRTTLSNAGSRAELETRMQNVLDPNNLDPDATRKFIESVSATGNLMLFRYLDFDLEPGNVYRYKVRLKLRNPNFRRPEEELARADIAEGVYRFTPWSKPTEPILVPSDSSIALQQIDRPNRASEDPKADVEVYQWFEPTGLIVKSAMKVEPGEFIGGKSKVLKIDPAKETWEENAEVDLATGEFLLDIAEVPFLKRNDHPELELPPSASRPDDFPVPSYALVLTDEGALRPLDPISEDGTLSWLRKRIVAEQNFFSWIKEQAEAAAAAEDAEGLEFEGEEMMMEEEGGGRRRGGRRANPLRLGS